MTMKKRARLFCAVALLFYIVMLLKTSTAAVRLAAPLPMLLYLGWYCRHGKEFMPNRTTTQIYLDALFAVAALAIIEGFSIRQIFFL